MTLRALGIAASGGRAFLRQIDLIAANLANANTIGYKRNRASFADLPAWGGLGAGVRLQSVERLFEPGTLQATHRELDLAIEGEGFLRVSLPDRRIAFTRAGNLRLDDDGNLTTADGHLIDPPVQVPPGFSRIVIDPEGLVQAFDGQDLQPVGQIELARFANPSGLESIGESLFGATAASGERLDGIPGQGFGVIRQGHLEQSNVDPVRELADLVQAQRAFEMNARTIQAADEILQSINNLRRKP